MKIKRLMLITAAVLVLVSCGSPGSGKIEPADSDAESGDAGREELTLMSAEKSESGGIGMIVTGFDGETLTLLVENHSGSGWSYGEEFSLSRKTGDAWTLLEWPEGTAWIDVIYRIPDGETKELTCSIDLLGKLEAGDYKLEKNGQEVYFSLG